MNRPWMPLYVADYLADTAHLDAMESGAYLHLIMHYWQTGGLPDDQRKLAQIAKVSSHCWKKICPTIQKFFHDGWKHKRIDEELARACDISEKRRDAAAARHGARRANAPSIAEQLDTHARATPQSQSHEESPSLRSGEPPPTKVVDQRVRIPADWALSDADQQFTLDQGLTQIEIETAVPEFVGYWSGRRDRGAFKTARGWSATWRNRVLDIVARRGRFTRGRGPPAREPGFIELAQQSREDWYGTGTDDTAATEAPELPGFATAAARP